MSLNQPWSGANRVDYPEPANAFGNDGLLAASVGDRVPALLLWQIAVACSRRVEPMSKRDGRRLALDAISRNVIGASRHGTVGRN